MDSKNDLSITDINTHKLNKHYPKRKKIKTINFTPIENNINNTNNTNKTDN